MQKFIEVPPQALALNFIFGSTIVWNETVTSVEKQNV